MNLAQDLEEVFAIQAKLSVRYAKARSLEEEREMIKADVIPVWAPNVADTLIGPELLINDSGQEVPIRHFPPHVEGLAPAILLVHGGGWVFGSIESDLHLHSAMVAQGIHSVGVTYRLAPENPFPAGRDDVISAYCWLRENALTLKIDPNRIAIGGCSAGANLAVSAMLRMRELEIPMPCAQILFYGVFGVNFDTESYRQFGDGHMGLSQSRMELFLKAYVGDHSANDTQIDVINADLHDLPTAWIGIAGLDVLRDDSRMFAAELRNAGVKVESVEYSNLNHGFSSRAQYLREAKVAQNLAAKFLTSQCRILASTLELPEDQI